MPVAPDSITAFDGDPAIVHLSDVHGYLSEARSALRAVGETAQFAPIVTSEDGQLRWAGNDYVLIVNGDLIDRGPANEACLELVWRLQREAPPGRVRYHIGNHEMAILLPELVYWPNTYSTSLDREERHEFLTKVCDGNVTAAFEGYEYLYSHAGRNEAVSVQRINEDLQRAAESLRSVAPNDTDIQRRLESEYDHIFALGRNGGRGADAGLCWMDFAHLEASAPPQIVGHSMRARPVRKGNVICGNIIRQNQGTPGGEGVLIEAPESGSVTAVIRQQDGAVQTTTV